MIILKFLFSKISSLLSSKNIYLIKSLSFRSKQQALPTNFDYVRFATLGLCYEEIVSNGVKGNVAELGVYKGDFSKRLNLLFPERNLYLFDTFSGFDANDVKIENTHGYSKGNQDFSDTSIEIVLKKMTTPQNCIIKKGTFPQTTDGVNDTFCLVSIDADLFQPIYQGLQFFYPRLEKGGFIFIHDFNNEHYLGARQAVLKFCKENEISYIPIPDSGGTTIISKGMSST